MSRTLGPELDNHVDEMCARADILWSTLQQYLRIALSDDPEQAKVMEEFYGGYYDALMENQRVVIDALPWKPEQ